MKIFLQGKWVLCITISVLLIAIIAGCQSGSDEIPVSSPKTPPVVQTEVGGTPAKTAKEAAKEPDHQKKSLGISSPGDNESESHDYPSYTVESPSLMGLTVGSYKKEVIGKLGNPTDQFMMEEDLDPITVFEYEGCFIGFNRFDQVEFIEITSPEVKTGLGGLRLGDTVEQAAAALGDPDSKNEYVMSYIASDTILKFDIDPNTQTISSIKLFSTEY
jgi:hypothetical protein